MSRRPSKIVLEKWLAKKERELHSLKVDAQRQWAAAPRRPDSYAGEPLLGKIIDRNPQNPEDDQPTVSAWRYNLLKLEPDTGRIRWRSMIRRWAGQEANIYELLVGPEIMWGILLGPQFAFETVTIATNGDAIRWDMENGRAGVDLRVGGLNRVEFPSLCVADDGNLVELSQSSLVTRSIATDLSVAWTFDNADLFSGNATVPQSIARTSGGILLADRGVNIFYPPTVDGYHATLTTSGVLASETVASEVAAIGGFHEGEYGTISTGDSIYFQRLADWANAVDITTTRIFQSSIGGDGVYTAARNSSLFVVRKYSFDLTTLHWTLSMTVSASGFGSIAAMPDAGCVIALSAEVTIDGLSGTIFRLDADGHAVWSQTDHLGNTQFRVRVGYNGFIYIAGPPRTRNQTP